MNWQKRLDELTQSRAALAQELAQLQQRLAQVRQALDRHDGAIAVLRDGLSGSAGDGSDGGDGESESPAEDDGA